MKSLIDDPDAVAAIRGQAPAESPRPLRDTRPLPVQTAPPPTAPKPPSASPGPRIGIGCYGCRTFYSNAAILAGTSLSHAIQCPSRNTLQPIYAQPQPQMEGEAGAAQREGTLVCPGCDTEYVDSPIGEQGFADHMEACPMVFDDPDLLLEYPSVPDTESRGAYGGLLPEGWDWASGPSAKDLRREERALRKAKQQNRDIVADIRRISVRALREEDEAERTP